MNIKDLFLIFFISLFPVIDIMGDSKKLPPRVSSYPYITGDTFRSMCNFIIDETHIPFNPTKVKKGDLIFLNPAYMNVFFTKFHPNIKHPYILISHNEIIPVPGSFYSYLDDPKLAGWFGKNVQAKHEKLFPIPVGIMNKYLHIWGYGPKENTKVFDTVRAQLPLEKNKLLYLNFAVNNPIRQYVYGLFKDKSFCCCAKRKSLVDYLVDLAESKFVLSPQGGGFDCWRTWEVLLMGSIPIVEHSAMDSIFEDLPVLIIHDWSDITEEYLNEKYEEMLLKTYNTDKVFAPYWFNKIRQYQEVVHARDSFDFQSDTSRKKHNTGIERLQKKYDWPIEKPNVPPDGHGWFANQRQLQAILNDTMAVIVELGSWLGSSTRFLLDKAPYATVIAVDHWQGSAEHQGRPDVVDKLPILYETFLVNCWGYKDRLIPMKTTTLAGLDEIYQYGIKPDLVYVDASHDFDSVLNDLEKIYQLFPDTLITGDDWAYGKPQDNFPVRRAIEEFVKRHNLKVYGDECFWIVLKN